MDYILHIFDILTKIGGNTINIFGYGIGLDKFMHFFIIFILGGLVFFLLDNYIKNTKEKIIINIIILLFIGIGKEFFDLFIRKTSFGFLDIVADVLGIIFITYLYYLLKKKGKKSEKSESFFEK